MDGYLSTDYLRCIKNCADLYPATPVPGDDNVCRPCSYEQDGGDYWDPQERKCVFSCAETHTKDKVCASCVS